MRIVSPSENLGEAVKYSTAFEASRFPEKRVLFLPLSEKREFKIGPYPLPTGGKGKIVYARQPSNRRLIIVDWMMIDIPGVNNPVIDTPEVSQAVTKISKILEDVNPGFNFSILETSAPDGFRAPRGLDDTARDAVKSAKDAAAGIGKGVESIFRQLTTPIFVIAGILAVGLAVGLTKGTGVSVRG